MISHRTQAVERGKEFAAVIFVLISEAKEIIKASAFEWIRDKAELEVLT